MKLQMTPRFPANVTAVNGDTVSKSNGTYTFGPDYSSLATAAGPSDTLFARAWDSIAGTYKRISIGAFLVARTRAAADVTLYVRGDGMNIGNGLADTAASAFATLQAAYDYACASYDMAGHNLTIRSTNAATIYSSGLVTDNVLTGTAGCASVIIDFNGGTIRVTNGDCIAIGAANGWGGLVNLTTQNVKLTTLSSGNCMSNRGGIITVNAGTDFGACAGIHRYTGHGAQTLVNGCTVSGSATYGSYSYAGSYYVEEGAAITISQAVTFNYWLVLTVGAKAQVGGAAYTNKGNVTGGRYNLSSGSSLNTGGAAANFLPGTIAGVCDETSDVDGIMGGSAWTAYTPAILAQTNDPITTKSGAGYYQIQGKKLFLQVNVTITTAGTATGILIVSLPPGCVAPAHDQTGTGNLFSMSTLTVRLPANATSINVSKYDATSIIADAVTVTVGGVFEII